MATIRISQLPSITGANAAVDDTLPIVDTSLNITNKITRQEFFVNTPSIGVGTSTPDRTGFTVANNNRILKVDGSITLPYLVTGAEPFRIGAFATTNFAQGTSSTGNAVGLTISNWNEVGGGSTVLQAGTDAGAGGIVLQARQTNVGVVTRLAEFYMGTSAFYTNNTERMRIDASGNLGVGITNPAYKLVVSAGGASGIEFGPAFSGTANLVQHYSRSGGVYVDAVTEAAQHRFNISGTERMRLDASGNLGLGVTPSAWGAAFRVTQIGAATSVGTESSVASVFANNAIFDSSWKYLGSGRGATNYSPNDGQHRWFTAPSGTAGNAITFTQAMTLDASGYLHLNRTNLVSGFASVLNMSHNGGSIFGIMLQNISTTTSNALSFINSSSTSVGAIVTSTTATSYNTSSDYRLKENVQPMQNALATVSQLNPVTYTWKADGSDGQGFIAHELQAVVPECVTGEKDAEDEDGNPQYQGVDTSFLVATLVKAIQELKAEVDDLRAQLNP